MATNNNNNTSGMTASDWIGFLDQKPETERRVMLDVMRQRVSDGVNVNRVRAEAAPDAALGGLTAAEAVESAFEYLNRISDVLDHYGIVAVAVAR